MNFKLHLLRIVFLSITVTFGFTAKAQLCSGLTNLTATSGTISDGSGSANYANNSNCTWLIQPSGNPANISFTMDTIDLAGFIDAVRVYDGTSAAGTLVAIYRGTNLGFTAIANSGSMFVEFTSNGFGNAGGWHGSYTSSLTNCQPNTVLTAPNGSFTDGTRNGADYANNTNCEWLIQPTTPGLFVEVNFGRFAVAGGDSVILYDGSNASAPVLAALTGNVNPGVYQSTGGSLFVRFVTNAIGPANGWTIIYNTQPIPFCRGLTVLNSQSGLFNDGSFPFTNYVENSNCEWLIQPPGAVTIDLQFNYFSTEANFDFVNVYQGTNNNGVLLGSFSGNRLPPTVTSTTGTMFVEFNTDNAVNSTGWEGSYTSSNIATITAPDTVYLNAGAGSRNSFQLNANASWSISDNQGWLIASPVNGTGNSSVNILAIQGNIGPERTAQLYINATNGNGGDTVTVIQRSSGRFLDITEDTLFFPATNPPSKSFSLISNVTWSLSSSAGWISVNPANGSNNGSPQISLSSNTVNQIRRDYIVASGTQNAGNDTIYIVQDSARFFFSASPKSIVLASDAGSSDSIRVSGNIGWTASSSATWLSISPATGSDSATVVISAITETPTTQSRSADVILNSSNGLFSDTIQVVQNGITPQLITTPDTLFFESDASLYDTVNIISTGSWNASVTGPFDINKIGGSRNDFISVKTLSANQSGSIINGTLTINDPVDSLSSTVLLIQKSIIPTLTVTPDSMLFTPNAGEQAIATITSNVFWSVSTSATWLNLSKASGNGNDSLTISTNSQNASGSTRIANVIFSAPGGINRTIRVTQFDGSSSFLLFSVDTVYLNSTSGSVANFSVISTTSWSLLETSSWLQLNKTTGSGTESVTARAGSNNLFGSPRYATVTSSVSGQPSRTLIVTQLGAPLSFSYAPDSLIIGADSASFGKFNLTSNLAQWTASTTDNWIRVSPSSGNLTAELTVTAVRPNNTGLPRNSSVVISAPPFAPLVAKVVQDTVRSIGLNERELAQQLSVFPNPTNDVVYLEFQSNLDASTANITLFDALGKEVKAKLELNSQYRITLNLGDLISGFYFVRINVGKESVSKKIMLQKR